LSQATSEQFRPASRSPLPDTAQDNRKIANVVIARDLNSASSLVQIQALEVSAAAYYSLFADILKLPAYPNQTHPLSYYNAQCSQPLSSNCAAFLVGSKVGQPSCRSSTYCYAIESNSWQNDQIFISHYHDPGDGFPNLEEGSEWLADDGASTSSVVRKSRVDYPKVWHEDVLFSDVVWREANSL